MDLKLGHYDMDGIEGLNVQGEIDIYTAPRLRELLIDLAGKNSYQFVVSLEKVGFLDSTGLGVLVGGLNRAHDGSLDLVCTQDPEDLPDHRADQGLRHPPDSGPGHRGQEGAPVTANGLSVERRGSRYHPARQLTPTSPGTVADEPTAGNY